MTRSMVLALIVVATSVYFSWPMREETKARSLDLVHLPPGTRLTHLESGWTHRIIRSVPRLASGDVATLPAASRVSAALFRTIVLAEVARVGDGYRLIRVGVGNAMPFDGDEIVVTTRAPGRIIDGLSTLDRLVLRAAEGKLAEASIETQTATFALLRTPGYLLLDGKHTEVDLRYAILVDPKSGRLRTLTWATSTHSAVAPRSVIALPEGCEFDCALDVAVTTRIGPIAIAWSFAMRSLPGGRAVEVPSEVGRVIGNRADPIRLEQGLANLFIEPGGP